ncbi:MAG TPA: ferrochelatase [Streptosporangiaceae bacterium]
MVNKDTAADKNTAGYDAFLLVSFGGPEGPQDVLPFLENVTAGRGVPRDRLEQVAEHYYQFGGVSPINQQNRDLIAAVEKDFASRGVSLPVYWGNRNWDPYLVATLAEMAAAGVTRAMALLTSAYSSFSSCRQYLGDIETARAHLGSGAPQVDKIRQYFNHPGFVGSFADAAARAVASLPAGTGDAFDLIFTAHSIPVGMAAASGPPGWRGEPASQPGHAYQAQLAQVADLVAERIGYQRQWLLAYSSRSGPPSRPWLEPDINDLLAERAAAGSRAVVVVPIGFVSDHMEVKFDLDVEAAETARRLGLAFARAATPGTDPQFVSMITDLVLERLEGEPQQALGTMGPWHDTCPAGCCALGPARPAGTAA